MIESLVSHRTCMTELEWPRRETKQMSTPYSGVRCLILLVIVGVVLLDTSALAQEVTASKRTSSSRGILLVDDYALIGGAPLAEPGESSSSQSRTAVGAFMPGPAREMPTPTLTIRRRPLASVVVVNVYRLAGMPLMEAAVSQPAGAPAGLTKRGRRILIGTGIGGGLGCFFGAGYGDGNLCVSYALIGAGIGAGFAALLGD